jgi:uncharacterized protein YjeT (DUF2065 family)
MSASILIAKLLGPYLLVTGLATLTRPSLIADMAREFLASSALIFLAGTMALVTGLAIVATHNRWTADWTLIITIFGWLAIVGGIARIAFPEAAKGAGEAMLARPLALRIGGLAQILLGAILAGFGYF